jgi:hypothetical protein
VEDQIKFGGNIVDTSKQKPDLMGASTAAPTHAKRILAHLEHGAKLPASKPARATGWTIDGWTLGLGLLLLTMCCIAWLMHDDGAQSSGFKQSHGGGARYESRQESRQHSAAAELARAETPARTPDAQTEQPAAIIIETAHDPAAHVDARREAATRPGRAGVVATSSAATSGVAQPNPGAAGAGIKHSAGAAPARVSATMHTPPRGTSTSVNDTDVALLTALVAHAGKPAVSAPERSRDIVERHDNDSTAELLARCKQLGVIEGMLCRSRICSGRWDSDPVCRAPAHYSSTQ